MVSHNSEVQLRNSADKKNYQYKLSNALHQETTIHLYIYSYEVLRDSLEVDLDI